MKRQKKIGQRPSFKVPKDLIQHAEVRFACRRISRLSPHDLTTWRGHLTETRLIFMPIRKTSIIRIIKVSLFARPTLSVECHHPCTPCPPRSSFLLLLCCLHSEPRSNKMNTRISCGLFRRQLYDSITKTDLN